MVTWIIESHIFWDTKDQEITDRLVKAIQYHGFNIEMITPYTIFNSKPFDTTLAGPYIFLGSLQTAKLLQTTEKFKHAVYCDWDVFKCTSYYPRYKNTLLNWNHIFLNFASLADKKDFIFESMSEDNAVFIRPDSGFKTFTGQLVYKESFNKDLNYFEFYEPAPDSLVVVSNPVNILREYRFYIIDGKVITGSLYKANNKHVEREIFENELIFKTANDIAKMWQPQDMFVLDLCETKTGEVKIVEINSFSCSGQYSCNLKKLIKAVAEYVMATHHSK